jgi:hypothetical protein
MSSQTFSPLDPPARPLAYGLAFLWKWDQFFLNFLQDDKQRTYTVTEDFPTTGS